MSICVIDKTCNRFEILMPRDKDAVASFEGDSYPVRIQMSTQTLYQSSSFKRKTQSSTSNSFILGRNITWTANCMECGKRTSGLLSGMQSSLSLPCSCEGLVRMYLFKDDMYCFWTPCSCGPFSFKNITDEIVFD